MEPRDEAASVKREWLERTFEEVKNWRRAAHVRIHTGTVVVSALGEGTRALGQVPNVAALVRSALRIDPRLPDPGTV